MTLAPRTRTVLLATLALWVGSVVAFALGMMIPARGPLPSWLFGWLTVIPIPGIPLSLLIYRQALRWQIMPNAYRWWRLVPLFLSLAVTQATIDHLLFMGFEQTFGHDGRVTPLNILRGIAFNSVIYVWLFGLYTVVVEMILTTERAARLQKAEAEARAEARQAQLEVLRGQLNPHFLFNTLNNLSALVVSERHGEADRMIGQLARYLRCSLDQEGVDESPLRAEIDFVRAYLDIEALRFPHPLALRIDTTGSARAALTPSLLLQPLIEGLVREVVAPAQGRAEIVVGARQSGDQLVMRLTGSRLEGEALPDMTRRIEATRARLGLLYGARAEVGATPSPGGVSIEIRLPWRSEMAMHAA